jgi:hypothetical protein
MLTKTTEKRRTINCMGDRDAFQRRQTAISWADNARIKVDELLTWAELEWNQREQLTQAANALELACHCLRFVGPETPVSIGF